MVDRGQLELAQVTKRLLVSRDRPKRQWFIQRIGGLWSVPKPLQIARVRGKKLFGAEPTLESIEAVRSFSTDALVNVRAAVGFALTQIVVVNQDARDTLIQMLDDPSPCVRSSAGYGLSRAAWEGLLSEVQINKALQNPTWSVRWEIARSISASRFADQGWATLQSSLPGNEFYLSIWLQHCQPYWTKFQADAEFSEKVKRLISDVVDPGIRKNCIDYLEWLFARRGK